MKDYLLITAAAVLFAAEFLIHKQYQRKAGAAAEAALVFNALMGLIIAAMFWAASGFRIEFSPFSILMAFLMGVLVVLYTVLGFQILKVGNVSHYTLFLMTGGMTIPYVWGLLFLNEPLTLPRLAGLLLIIAAIIISNSGEKRPDGRELLLCVAVFVINGFVSVVSKLHQIDTLHYPVGTVNFVCLVGLTRFVFCTLTLLCRRTKGDFRLPPLRKVFPIIFIAAIANGFAELCNLMGAINLPASVLYPFVTGGSIALSALAGMLFLHERLERRSWIGIALCFLGTCLFL